MKYTIKFHQINKFINNFFISMPFFVNNKKKKINFLNNKENPFFHFSDHFSE